MTAQTADMVIIGGGITGTSAAYQLALRGYRTILLERRHLAAGGTGRTGGIIRQHYSNEITARMALRALHVWRDFDNCVGGDPGWVHTGALFMVGPNDTEGLKANIALQQSVGINTEFVDAAAIRKFAPYLQLEDIGGAAYEPDSGYADGSMAANAYASRAKALGAVIQQGTEVTAITVESGRVTGVETSQGPVRAPVVVNAGGAWGVRLVRALGYDVPVEASRHQIAVFHQPANMPAPRHPVVADFMQGYYMRPETGGLTLAGSIEATEAANKVDPDQYVETVDMDFNLDMADRTEHRMPVMREARVGRCWAGIYDVSLDWHPVIACMPGVEGLVCAFGFSGSGFKMGPVVGEMVADLATGERRCPIDPQPFRFERFAENKLIQSRYSYGVIG
jgi:sarcosine oxidase subunit beta